MATIPQTTFSKNYELEYFDSDFIEFTPKGSIDDKHNNGLR